MNYNRAAMKEEVKLAMRQTRPKPMLVTLLYLVIVAVGTQLISRLLNTLFSGSSISTDDMVMGFITYGPDYFEDIMNYFSPQHFMQMMLMSALVSVLISVLTTVWNGLMGAGYSGYCLDMSRSMNPQLPRIFGGFSRAGSVILAYVLVAVFTFLWSLLFGVGLGVLIGVAFILSDISEVLAVVVLFAAPVLYAVALIWMVLRYAMVPFAVIDSQIPMSAMDAIRTSKALMKGRKGKYFALQLSFIGWYLLQALIALVGVIAAVILLAVTAASFSDDPLYLASMMMNAILLGDFASMIQLFGPAVVVAALFAVGIFVLNLWLTPYRTGSNARFYTYAMDNTQLVPPGPYGGQPSAPYGGPSGPYGGQPPIQPYGGQPGAPYGGQSGTPYGSQPGTPYGSQPGTPYGQPGASYGSQPGAPYGSQPGTPYGSQPGTPYGGQSAPSYDGQSGPAYGSQFGPVYGSQSGPSYGGQPDSAYGSQFGPSYGGYTQMEQPPQYGGGSYPQWGAPQSFSATEPLVPEAPAASGAPTVLLGEDSDGSDLSSRPTIKFDASDDDTPQQPNGPNYPQY